LDNLYVEKKLNLTKMILIY